MFNLLNFPRKQNLRPGPKRIFIWEGITGNKSRKLHKQNKRTLLICAMGKWAELYFDYLILCIVSTFWHIHSGDWTKKSTPLLFTIYLLFTVVILTRWGIYSFVNPNLHMYTNQVFHRCPLVTYLPWKLWRKKQKIIIVKES